MSGSDDLEHRLRDHIAALRAHLDAVRRQQPIPPLSIAEHDDRVIRWELPPRRSPGRRLLTVVAGAVLALVALGLLLASVGPLVLPYRTYFVRSGSMEPTIAKGALVVFTRADRGELGPGDIITFAIPDGTRVTHRIVEVDEVGGEATFVTKGDANAVRDPWAVRASSVRWVHAFDVPVLGSVFQALADPAARVALLGVPALALVGLSLADRRRSAGR